MDPSHEGCMRTYSHVFRSIEAMLTAAHGAKDNKTSDQLCAAAIWTLAASMRGDRDSVVCARAALFKASKALYEHEELMQIIDEFMGNDSL